MVRADGGVGGGWRWSGEEGLKGGGEDEDEVATCLGW